MRAKPQIGSPRLRLGPLETRSGLDRRNGPRRSPSRDGSTRRKGLRFAPIALRATQPLRRALGLRPTVNGETPRRRSNRRPMPPRNEKTVPAPHPSGAAPPKAERRRDRGPLGGIAPESGLTARLPCGTGSSVAQERRFDLRTGEGSHRRARTRLRGQESTKTGTGCKRLPAYGPMVKSSR